MGGIGTKQHYLTKRSPLVICAMALAFTPLLAACDGSGSAPTPTAIAGTTDSAGVEPTEQANTSTITVTASSTTTITATSTTTATTSVAETTASLTLRGHSDWVMSAVFSPNGETIATAGADGAVNLWDVASGQERRTIRVGGRVVSVAYSPDGKQIVTANSDEDRAKVWDPVSGALLATLCCHEGGGYVTGAAYSPDGRLIASAEHSSTPDVKVWDATSGQERRTLTGLNDAIYSPAWSADGTKVAASSEADEVIVWDVTNGNVLLYIQNHQGSAQADTSAVHSVAFSPDGKAILTGGDDGAARVWNLADSKTDAKPLLAIQHPMSEQDAPQSSDPIPYLAKVKGGWAPAAKMVAAHDWAIPLLHTRWKLTAAYSPDGRSILTAGSDGTGRQWDAVNGQPMLILQGHGGWVFSATYSQNGRRAVTASADRTAKVWDLQP